MKLKEGEKAPDFTVNNQNGESVSLSDYKGKKVALYFYPKDNTPGCTAEACNLRDHHTDLQKAGYTILGVSKDSENSHKKFIEKQSLPFDLLSDTELEIHHKYGTWVEKNMYGRKYMGTARMTFIIDEDGNIEKIIGKVKTKDHASQILN